MSNQSNSFSTPISNEMIRNIAQLNLTIIQKHHIRLLAHCLAILKEISKNETPTFDEDELLRDWCVKKSQKFNDQNFNELFYKQMSSAAKKLNSFSLKQGKNFRELELKDLIALVKQNYEN